MILLDTIDNRKEFPGMKFHGYTSGGKMDKNKFILFGKIGICIETESDFLNIILISSFFNFE